MKLSDYVAQFVRDLGIRHVFGNPGGGNMHLVDSFRDSFVVFHHEQAAGFAADGYARLNGLGCCLVTTGPGGTNAITAVNSAWVDSVPILFISGQCGTDQLCSGTKLRQFGVQETDIISLVKPITKYAVSVRDVKDIRRVMETALFHATDGRQGPVWVDIPLDISCADVDPREGYDGIHVSPLPDYKKAYSALLLSERPVIIIGEGCRGSDVYSFCEALGVPVVTTWAAMDLYNGTNYIGSFGIMGDVASNLAVEESDFILILGASMTVPHLGYQWSKFAPNAKIARVDINPVEFDQSFLPTDIAIQAKCKDFIEFFPRNGPDVREWMQRIQTKKLLNPIVHSDYPKTNSWRFVDELAQATTDDDILVTDMGASNTSTHQAFRVKMGQRLFSATGFAQMGYGLPAGIGACLASGRRVVIIHGDGGLQVNIQALANMRGLPITLFVLNNDGYLTIKNTQTKYFGRMVGADPSSGLFLPDLQRIAQAYELPYWKYENEIIIKPGICEVMIDPMQNLKL